MSSFIICTHHQISLQEG